MTSPEGKYEQEFREDHEQEGLVVRDRRRVDPETGAVREPAEASAPGAPDDTGKGATAPAGGTEAAAGGSAELAEQVASLQAQLADAVADVQRVQAEYANYRKRVDRDRSAVREQALANVLSDLLPVLDDVGRAREHGELEGGFRQVGESLEQIATKLGLVRFGETGDAFDPTVHEALMHSYSSEVSVTTCAQVLQPGYALNERVLRPARVAVAEPESPETHEAPDSPDSGEEAETRGGTTENETSES